MRERGFTVLEVTIALSVVVVLASVALGGVRAHQVSIAREWSRLAASRAAATRLEVVRADGAELRAGSCEFSPGVAGAEGKETVREIEPGLYEVRAEVRHEADGVRVEIVTIVAQEATP